MANMDAGNIIAKNSADQGITGQAVFGKESDTAIFFIITAKIYIYSDMLFTGLKWGGRRKTHVKI